MELESRFSQVLAAAKRLQGVANHTPVMTSRQLDQHLQARAFLKCENFQRVGAFKFRGAYNAMCRFLEQRDAQDPNFIDKRGVITHSSGNHAQAIALAGQLLNVDTTIVMPEDAPAVKLAATEGYGARIVKYNRHTHCREAISLEMSEQQQLYLIPPFDHEDVIAGQGTAALELIEHTQKLGVELDALVVCLGGGGLLSGSIIAAKSKLPNLKVYGVEPLAGNDGLLSLQQGKLVLINNPDTIADGARTNLCQRTFDLIRTFGDGIVTVDDVELVESMRFAYSRMKLVIEPTGALALAACLQHRLPEQHQNIGVLISGGNVDLAELGRFFAPQ